MTQKYIGGFITKNPTAPTASVAQGIWTLQQAANYTKQGIWPRSPSAPTIGTATAGSSGCASITFSAPSCVGTGALSYKLVSTPGCFQNTGSSSPVVVSGLTSGTSYTFKAYGVTPGGTGPASSSSNSITASSAGSQQYCSGSYSWVAPAGVTKVSVLVVGSGGNGGTGTCTPGGGGGGGALAYVNNYTVVPGNSYTVVAAAGGVGVSGSSYFVSCAVASARNGANGATYGGGAGGIVIAGTGGSGGNGGSTAQNSGGSGGGGAGGYSGAGGAGVGRPTGTGNNGSGGGGGGGGTCGNSAIGGGGGGGVGMQGTGSSGTGGACGAYGGGGGSGGNSGTRAGQQGVGGGGGKRAGNGGAYGGGGGGGGAYTCCGYGLSGFGNTGAVRIIWPGNTRSFPSTCTGSP